MVTTKSPYKIVEGKIPTTKEFSEWSHDKWLDFLRFLDSYVEVGKKGDVYKVTLDKMKEMETYLQIHNHPYQEHIYRIGLYSNFTNPRAYFYKLNSYARMGLTYLKKHPGIVSPEMTEILASKTRFSWALNQYKVEEVNDTEVVTRDTETLDGFHKKQVNMPNIQVKLLSSMVKLADIYETVANSLSTKDLKALKTMDKLTILKNLQFIFTAGGKKITPNHFTQINVNASNVKEAEESMLNFIKNKQN